MYRAREHRIEIIKQRLLRKSAPRFHVSLILLFTGLAGFLISFLLLHSGVSRMWLRYPMAILAAYFVFLLLLRFWLSQHRPQREIGIDPSFLDFDLPVASSHGGSFEFGGGGNFGGGGAGGSWGESVSASSTSGGSSHSGGFSIDLDLDEGWLVVIAVIAVIGGIVGALYVIYIAPALLAEILVDGVLVTGLYSQVKRVEQRHWLRAAVRRTILPALLATLFLAVAGYALQKAYPKARSARDLWGYAEKAGR
jgi:uncharacterized membrane protein YfcA